MALNVRNKRLLHITPDPRPWFTAGSSLCRKLPAPANMAPFEIAGRVEYRKDGRERRIPVAIYLGEERRVCELCLSGGAGDKEAEG